MIYSEDCESKEKDLDSASDLGDREKVESNGHGDSCDVGRMQKMQIQRMCIWLDFLCICISSSVKIWLIG